MREAKGITLVALIITIIVAGILIGVVAEIAIDKKVVDITKDAVEKTNNRVHKEQDRVDELMQKF